MDKKQIAQALGSLGGQATSKKYGKEQMKEWAKLGAKKRWANKKKKGEE